QRSFELHARVPLEADLGRDGDALARGFERAAQDRLRQAVAVGGCRVEERDAALEREADRGDAIGFVRGRAPATAADRPGAEPEPGTGAHETRKGPDQSSGPSLRHLRHAQAWQVGTSSLVSTISGR